MNKSSQKSKNRDANWILNDERVVCLGEAPAGRKRSVALAFFRCLAHTHRATQRFEDKTHRNKESVAPLIGRGLIRSAMIRS